VSFIDKFPELFPNGIKKGYTLKEIRFLKKTGIPTRRILVDGVSYTIRPSFVMPYLVAFLADVENALFLRKFNVPFWALSHTFGKDAMYWPNDIILAMLFIIRMCTPLQNDQGIIQRWSAMFLEGGDMDSMVFAMHGSGKHQ